MKVYAAGIQTETNTFSPVPTSLEMFEETYKTFRGQDPINPNFWGAPMVEFANLAKKYGDIYIEGLCVAAEPAGIVPKNVYENYRDEILEDLKINLPVDMVLLNLHGAMVADGYDDCEGDLITKIRNLVGTNVPIGVELDLHAHLTETMINQADLLISFKLYPHTDVEKRANELYQLTRMLALKQLTLNHAYYDCEMINLFPTGNSPIKELVNSLFELEMTDEKIISISFIHGFIWGDVPDLGAKILVYTDARLDPNKEYAFDTAKKLGETLYSSREATKVDLYNLETLVTKINTPSSKPYIVGDFSDNPGLGGMGDATFILEKILETKQSNVVFSTIYDPEVVKASFATDKNKDLSIMLGGKSSKFSGKTLKLKVKVIELNPNLKQTFCGLILPLGAAAVLEVNGNFIIVNNLRSQIYSPDAITNMGITIEDKKAIIVKSSEHFRSAFENYASEILRVSTPGVGNMDIKNIPYKNVKRKLWPINKE